MEHTQLAASAAAGNLLSFSMTADQAIGIGGVIVAILALFVAVFGIWDARREREKRELMIEAAHGAIGQLSGFIAGVKVIQKAIPQDAMAAELLVQLQDQQEHVAAWRKRLHDFRASKDAKK